MRSVHSSNGMTIQVGENAVENDRLCSGARQNDLWFHLDGKASPHAVLAMPVGKALQKQSKAQLNVAISEAAQLVKHFSSERDASQATVIYIPAKFVSLTGKAGSVELKKSAEKLRVISNEVVLQDLLSRINKV